MWAGTYLNAEYWYLKVDTAGNVLWSKDIAMNTYYESARTIIPASGNGALMTGHTVENFNLRRGYMVRINATGDTLWTKLLTSTLSPTNNIFIGEGTQLPNGNFVININDGSRSGILVVDDNGNTLDYRLIEEVAGSIPITINSVSSFGSTIYLAGNNQQNEALVIAMDPNFNVLFSRKFPSINYFNGVVRSASGYIILNGSNFSGQLANTAPIILMNSSGVPLRGIVAGKLPNNNIIPYRAVEINNHFLFTGHSTLQMYDEGYQIITDTLLFTGSCYSREIDFAGQPIVINWLSSSITSSPTTSIITSIVSTSNLNPTVYPLTYFGYQIDNVLFRNYILNGDACGGTCTGNATVSVSGGAAPYSYSWSNGSMFSTASNLCSGQSVLVAGDAFGCFFKDTIQVGSFTSGQSICVVTVDTTSTKNVVYWEKETTGNIDGYKIYRDVVGSYSLVGFVPYDSLSLFEDNTLGINPNITSYRYKVSVLDTCGYESDLSSFHKTIHITTSLGTFGEINLIWDGYVGFSSSFYYRILRDTIGLGNYQILDSVSNSNFTYTDFSPPVSGFPYYVVEVVFQDACEATRAINHNTTRSNRTTTSINGLYPESEQYSFTVSPNPAVSSFEVNCSRCTGSEELSISTIDGRTVLTGKSISGSKAIDISEFESGVYLVRIQGSKGPSFVKRLLISK
ncbi:MAG: T9SS type A sorting domain-containing protein [Flavobacteriales bacterium]